MHGTPAEVAMVSEGWFFTMKLYCILHEGGTEDNKLHIVAGHIQVRSRNKPIYRLTSTPRTIVGLARNETG
jgi:hypothetical protein